MTVSNSLEKNEKKSRNLKPDEKNPDEDNGHRQKRRRIVRLVAVGLVAVALVLGIFYYIHALSYESTDDAFIDGHVMRVSSRVAGHVARVYVADNQRVKAGDPLVDLDPADFRVLLHEAEATLAAGRATRRSRNAEVALITISAAADLDGAKSDVAAAEAAVEAARAQAAQTASQYEQAMAQIAINTATLAQAKAEADSVAAKHNRDAEDLKRYEEMRSARTVSGRDLDYAVAAEQISAADLVSAQKKIETCQSMIRQSEAAKKAALDNRHRAEAQVELAKAQLGRARARLAAAESAPKKVEQRRSLAEVSGAEVDKAKAQLARASLNLSYTHIVSPADGFVTKKGVEPGAFVQIGQSLMAIVPETVWVTANFKETQLEHMRCGQPVEITVDAYPNITFKGHVESIQRGTGARFSLLPPENATGNYVKVAQRIPVKITFDKPPDSGGVLLAPGMSVVPVVNIAETGKKNSKAL
jgi:membrane fusion protein, multidrug efflux system